MDMDRIKQLVELDLMLVHLDKEEHVNHLAEEPEVADSSEEDGYRARIAESSVAEMAVDAPKCSICPLVKWGMLRLRAYKGDFAN